MKETKKTMKKVTKESPSKKSGKFKITKPNGKVIGLGDYVKTYESKGCKVEEV